MFRYIHAPNPMTDARLFQGDEIAAYISGRWLGACEAASRVLSQSTDFVWPPVQKLAVHLPNAESVLFSGSEPLHDIIARGPAPSTLDAFFAYNAAHPDAPKLLYHEFPEHMVWHPHEREWWPRKRGVCVARMPTVSPADNERFHLRLLLTAVCGATSFDDLRTVDGALCDTFKEAARRRGLLADNTEWYRMLEELRTFATAPALRHTFVLLLINEEVTDPPALWQHFRRHMSEDHRAPSEAAAQRMTRDEVLTAAAERALRDIDAALRARGYSAQRFRLPLPHAVAPAENTLLTEAMRWTGEAARELRDKMVPCMRDDQRRAFQAVIEALKNRTPLNERAIFINGCAASGKTFLLRALCAHVRALGHVAYPTCATALGAQLVEGSRTFHTGFIVPLQCHRTSTCNIEKQSTKADVIRAIKLIIVDEATNLHRYAFEAANRTLRDVTGTHAPFGGIVTVLCGDFRQTAPIVKFGLRGAIVDASIRNSDLWSTFRTYTLQGNWRVQAAPAGDADAARRRQE
jgi:hypothetical protein